MKWYDPGEFLPAFGERFLVHALRDDCVKVRCLYHHEANMYWVWNHIKDNFGRWGYLNDNVDPLKFHPERLNPQDYFSNGGKW